MEIEREALIELFYAVRDLARYFDLVAATRGMSKEEDEMVKRMLKAVNGLAPAQRSVTGAER